MSLKRRLEAMERHAAKPHGDEWRAFFDRMPSTGEGHERCLAFLECIHPIQQAHPTDETFGEAFKADPDAPRLWRELAEYADANGIERPELRLS